MLSRLISILLIVALAYSASAKSIEARQILIDCVPKDGDKLLYQRHLEDSGKWLTVKHRDVIYPEDGNDAKEEINCIKAIDNMALTGTNGGKIEITAGGLGLTNLEMRITSERGYGYSYDIEIYGQKPATPEEPTTKPDETEEI